MAGAGTAPLTAGDPGRVGPYTTVGRLGAGALGVLYMARADDGGPAAVRALRPELLADPTVKARLAADVAAVRTVPGPYAVPVLGADLEAAQPWLASAYVAGVPLAQAVADHGPLPEPALLTLAAGLAEALAALHAAGVMHGDLRPGTVVLTAEGPRVVDHALERAFDGAAEVGMAGFLAPEQATGRTVTSAADMFALGSTLFFAAMGRAPFGTGTPAEVKTRVAKSSPVLGKLPASLSELIRGCFQKDPNNRAQPRQVLEYVQRRARIALGSGWLPADVAADVRAVADAAAAATAAPGGVATTMVGAPVVPGMRLDESSDANATLVVAPAAAPQPAAGGQIAGFGAGQHADGGSGAGFGQGQADTGMGFAVAPAAAPPGSQGGAFGGPHGQTGPQPVVQRPAPSRRNLLLALTGGAVVVVGGGAALAVGLNGGDSGTTPTAAAEPSTGTGSSIGAVPSTSAPGAGAPSSANAVTPPPRHPLPPTGPLSAPTGAAGSLQGPEAAAFWMLPNVDQVTSLAAGEGVLVVCGDAGVAGYDLGANLKWGPVQAAGVPGSGNGVVAGGVVYLIVGSGAGSGSASGGGEVLALDVKTGAEKWRAPLPPEAGPGARIGGALGGMVFVVGTLASSPFLWALDVADGKSPWQKSGPQYATLAVPASGTQILAAGAPGAAVPVSAEAVDLRSGDQAWARQLGTSVDYSRVSLSKAVYAGQRYIVLGGAPDADSLVAGTTTSGQDAWTSKLPESAGDAGTLGLLAGSPDGTAVVALSRRAVYVVEAGSGKFLWQSQGSEMFDTGSDSGAPQIADGNVYVHDQKGTWWAVDLASGKTRWRYQSSGYTPGSEPVWLAVSGGVVVSVGGKLALVPANG